MSHSQDYLSECSEIAKSISHAEIERLVRELHSLRDRGGRLFIAGLGGSAANASHAVNDFRKLCAINAIALNDNVSELTARANDEGWDSIYTGSLKASGAVSKDALLVLSVGGGTEGVSKPIFDAVNLSRDLGMKVFGIVGRDGGHTYKRGHCVILVPVKPNVTAHTESFQSVILHCLVSHPDLQVNKTKW